MPPKSWRSTTFDNISNVKLYQTTCENNKALCWYDDQPNRLHITHTHDKNSTDYLPNGPHVGTNNDPNLRDNVMEWLRQ